MLHVLAIALGYVLDLLFGDPHWLPHPVRWIGSLISVLESGLRSVFPKTPAGERAAGIVLVVLVAASPIFPTQKPFVRKLCEQHPEITSVVLNVNDRFGPVVLGTKEKVLYGEGVIEDDGLHIYFYEIGGDADA